jgi:hypothetical protein
MAGASGIKAGRAYVEIGTDESQLQKGLNAAGSKLKGFGAGIAAIGGVTAGLEGVIKGSFFGAAKVFADTGSELNDMSARTGVSVEALSALSHAAGMTGSDMATVEGAIRKMQKTLVKGSQENLAAESTFAALGLSVRELSKLSPEDQFSAIAGAINNIQDPTAKAAAAMEIFGKSGTALLPMISDLDNLTGQAKEFGLALSGDEAEKADAMGDAIDLLTATMGRVVTAVGSALAPVLTELAGFLASATKQVIDFVKANQPMIVMAFKLTTGLFALGSAFVAVGTMVYGLGATLGFVATGIGVVGSVLAFLVSPIGLVIAGLTALAAWFFTSTDAGTSALATLGKGFMDLKATALQAFGGISDALSAGDFQLAAQILWAGLNVEWVKGIAFLKGIWSEWSGWAVGIWADLNSQIASLMISGWAGVQAAWVIGTGAISNLWFGVLDTIEAGWIMLWGSVKNIFAKALGGLTKGLIDLVAEVKTQIAIAKGALTLSSSSHAIAEINKEAEARKAAEDKAVADTIKANQDMLAAQNAAAAKAAAKRKADQQGQLAGIGQTEMDQQAALKSQTEAEAAARKKAALDAAAAAAGEVTAAQDQLGSLTDKAGLLGALNRQGSALEAESAAAKAKTDAGLTPEAIDKSISDAKAKVDVAGSFSASALQGFGAGESVAKVADDQLKEQKGTNARLDKLQKTTEKKKAAFA